MADSEELEDIISKLKEGKQLTDKELVEFSKAIKKEKVVLNGQDTLVKNLVAQLEGKVQEGKVGSRDLRSNANDDLTRVSQVKRRFKIFGGQLGHQQRKQKNAKNMAKEAILHKDAQSFLNHVKIYKDEPTTGLSRAELIAQQTQLKAENKIWRHPWKHLRARSTLKKLEKPLPENNAGEKIERFLGEGPKTASWFNVSGKLKAYKQKHDLSAILNEGANSQLDGLYKGLQDQIDALTQKRDGTIIKKEKKGFQKQIDRLTKYQKMIEGQKEKRAKKLEKKNKKLESKRDKKLDKAQKKFDKSANITQKRDTSLQETSLLSQTLDKLDNTNLSEDTKKEIKETQEKYRAQIRDEKLEDSMEGLTAEQQEILKNRAANQQKEDKDPSAPKPEETKTVGAVDTPETVAEESPEVDKKDKNEELSSDYQPIKDNEGRNNDAVLYSKEENRYQIDLEKDNEKAVYDATVAAIQNQGFSSFKVDENVTPEFYAALKEAAGRADPPLKIENAADLEAKFAERETQSNQDEQNKPEPEKETQDKPRDEEQGQAPQNPEKEAEQSKNEELTLTEATRNIPKPEFDLEKQRWKISSEADFQEQISSLSPAEQKAAKEMRSLSIAENKERDGNNYDEHKQKLYTKKRGEILGKAHEAIKKERGITPENRRKPTRQQGQEGQQQQPMPQSHGSDGR